MKKINWLDHLVNLLVVIVGITIAFSLENWKESRNHRGVEKQYAISFIRDLDRDIATLDTLLTNDSTLLKALVRISKFESDGQLTDSVLWALGQIGIFNNFKSHNTTFESLISSGKFEEMWSLNIRIQVIENYHTSNNQLLDVESYFKRNFDENVLSLYIDDTAFVGNQIKKTLASRRFKNIINLHASLLRQKIVAARKCLQTSKELKTSFNDIIVT